MRHSFIDCNSSHSLYMCDNRIVCHELTTRIPLLEEQVVVAVVGKTMRDGRGRGLLLALACLLASLHFFNAYEDDNYEYLTYFG